MNCYTYNVRIFDTAPDADLKLFPRLEPHSAVAENEQEAQRKIVEDLFDSQKGGTLAKHSKPDDSPTRFNIVFDMLIPAREVAWNEEIGEWIWADESRELQIEAWKKWQKSS